MANELNGELAFPVGDASYLLRYSIPAQIALEDRLDLSMGEIVERLQGKVRIGFVRDVLAAGLAEHHKDLTAEQVADLIGGAGTIPTIGAILTAIAAAYPKPQKAGADAGPRKAVAGTGSAT